MSSTLRESLEKHLEPETEETEPVEVEETEPEPEAEETEPVADTVEEEPESDTVEDDAETEEEAEPDPTDYYTAPPSSLNAEERGEWSKWPAKARNCLLRREQDYQRGMHQAFTRASQAEQAAKRADAYDQVVGDHIQRMNLRGEDPVRVVNRMVAWDQFLAENPRAAVPQLLQAHGIDLQSLGQLMSQAPDPYASRLEGRLEQMERRLEEERQAIQQRDEQTYTAQMVAARDQFISQKDQRGYLRDPAALTNWAHLVETLVKVNQMPIGRAFERAYDMVIYGDPEKRAALEAQKERDSTKKRVEEEKAAARKAQRAASSITGAPAGATSGQRPKGLRESLEYHMRGVR